MPLPIPRHVLVICDTLQAAGYKAYVVGGGVRDALLGREPKDWDVATDARPERVQQLFPKTVPTGVRFGTVTVVDDEGNAVEVTTFRGESGYVDGRRPGWVEFVGSIEQDLVRRDFTVNAIAYDPARDVVVDPHGGQADLAARLIRAVGHADERFREDGLRVLRAVRIAVELGFEIEENTAAAIRRQGARLLKVSRERIGQEWRRMLSAPQAGRGVILLCELGLLPFVLPPGLNATSDAPGISAAAAALNRAHGCGLAAKTAIVLHGLGRPEHDERWLKRLVHPKAIARPARHLANLLRTFDLSAVSDDAALRRFLQALGRNHVDAFFCALKAIRPGGDAERVELRARRILERGDALTVNELAVDGYDVRAALPGASGREIGAALQHLLDHVLRHPEDNTKERLLSLLAAWRPKSG